MIEPGWDVVDREGEQVGRVEDVVGDSSADIFDGLSIATSFLGKPRYVAAERVGEITEGRVRLELSRSEVEALSEFLEPPTTAEIEPEQASVVTRLTQPLEAPIHAEPEREHVLRRLVLRTKAWLSQR